MSDDDDGDGGGGGDEDIGSGDDGWHLSILQEVENRSGPSLCVSPSLLIK